MGGGAQGFWSQPFWGHMEGSFLPWPPEKKEKKNQGGGRGRGGVGRGTWEGEDGALGEWREQSERRKLRGAKTRSQRVGQG